jgi:biotin-dependent carboxylase-like uncharacterized protein
LITVLKPGPLASVQDLGRPGYRHLGVGLSGALDALALAIGNALVGNAPGAAGLELTLPPARLRFESPCTIALTGAPCAAQLDQTPVGAGRRIAVAAGQTLDLAQPHAGVRAYLCVGGGIDVPPLLGSRSTDLAAHLGGYAGRALRAGDALPIAAPAPRGPDAPGGMVAPAAGVAAAVLLPERGGAIRVMAGPEFDEFDAAAHEALFRSDWTVTPQSNRMGFRLAGGSLRRKVTTPLNSHAVFPGLIQVPPAGTPIVLMADAQATGGYPRIGTVIAADLWRMAQVRPGATLRFEPATRAQAQAAWHRQQMYLQRMRASLGAHRCTSI